MKINFQGSQKMHVRVTISPKGLVKSILKFMFFIPPKPKSFKTTNSFYGNNFLTYHFLWRYVRNLLRFLAGYILFKPAPTTQ